MEPILELLQVKTKARLFLQGFQKSFAVLNLAWNQNEKVCPYPRIAPLVETHLTILLGLLLLHVTGNNAIHGVSNAVNAKRVGGSWNARRGSSNHHYFLANLGKSVCK